MTIDPYSPCPGGTGKKIKFCCSDLVHELDKLQRMIDGDQRVAGLDFVTKLDAKYPGRACLLSSRATLEAMLGNREQSAATLASFREKHPENPIALAELAVLQATGDHPTDAIASLQRGLELAGEEMPEPLYEAYGAVGVSLAEAGHFAPAMALLWFQVSISRREDKEALQRWASLDGDPAIPLVLKGRQTLDVAPPGAPWKYEFEIALKRGHSGLWQVAADKFAALAPIAGQSPVLWRNLALLRSWLADYAGTVEALRKYAALTDSIDEALEAEAAALHFDMLHRSQSIAEPPPSPADQLLISFDVNDQTLLEERFASDRQFDRLPIDPRMWSETTGQGADQPPPRAGYSFLDRPTPRDENVSRDQIPLVLGTLLLFGRQTDRRERLELIVSRFNLADARSQLSRIGGDALGAIVEEKVISHSLFRETELSWQWRFPDEVPEERRKELVQSERRHRLLEVWTETPLSDLDGQTPRQAAVNPGLRSRVLGLILIMEAGESLGSTAQLFADLRQRLGLPTPEPIDPATADLRNLPRVRLGRLQVEKLSDDQLIRTHRRATFPPQRQAMVLLATEIVGRASFAGRAEVADAYGVLAANAPDTTAALTFIEQGRAAAQRAKQSTAAWDLEELRLRLLRNEEQDAARLLQHLQREHAREPGVSESLLRILYEAGIVDEHGRRMAPPEPQGSPILVPGAAAPGKILVPGGESAAPAGEQSKPVIWTPGME